MQRICLLLSVAVAAWSAFADLTRIVCEQPGSWKIEKSESSPEPGVTLVRVSLKHDGATEFPKFDLVWDEPQIDIDHVWTPNPGRPVPTVLVDWEAPFKSSFAFELPLMALMNGRGRSKMTAACSETMRPMLFASGLVEETSRFKCCFRFFTQPEAPDDSYETEIRIDRRDIAWHAAVMDAARWLSKDHPPASSSDAAYEPLYSTWYNFHQDVHAADIERECAQAARLGMKTLIVDDGWQTDDTGRGYAYTGDWRPSPRRFPDMAGHVRKVQALGMKYMLWYGVPMVGRKSAAWTAFQDRFLWTDEQRGYGCLDPRFPEVREHLAGVFERAMKDWNIDGFKLDFIDAFDIRGTDPAVAVAYAGRDIKSVPEAVDRLLQDIMTRVRAVKPDALIEFRQSYYGPRVRKFANMVRAGDCPGDALTNRRRTVDLRLMCPGTSVHSDMLEWNDGERPEAAARQILACLFATVQYSRTLSTMKPEFLRMVRHWMAFMKEHRDTLLQGEFRPSHPEANYPLVEAEGPAERISAVYVLNTVVPVDARDKTVFVVNATGAEGVFVEMPAAAVAELFDVFGTSCGHVRVPYGLSRLAVPEAGYVKIGRLPRSERP